MSHHEEAPVTITTARTGHSADVRKRQTRYLISMGIRTACVVLAVVSSGTLRWAFVAGAAILPYIAVVMANASERRGEQGRIGYVDVSKPQITTGPTVDQAGRQPGSAEPPPAPR
jgi:Flp pilus assembly protein TadB